MNAKKIGFIGLGLIGGSIAKAIRQYYPDYDIIAFDKNKESLALAIQEGTIHTSCSSIDDNFRGCNYIFLCAPVTYNAAYLSQLKDLLDENCILTDVGSVKTSIHEEVIRLGMEANFIGGHPMAGSEKSGFMNSKAHLIENAYYILTPSAKVAEEKVDAYKDFVSSLKALPVILDYHEHDHITGTISHLPHIIASTLVNFVHDTDSKEGMMKSLAAGGFKDITRIASSSPVMWQQICLKNSENISQILGEYIEALSHAKDLVMKEMNLPCTLCLRIPKITGTPCRTDLQDRSKSSLHFIVISSMKQVELLRLPQFLQVITSVSRISESSTTVNSRKEFFVLNFMMKILQTELLYFCRNTAMSSMKSDSRNEE